MMRRDIRAMRARADAARRLRNALVADRMLSEFALQRAPMHSETARRRGDVAVVPAQHPVDVLPLESVDGERFFAHLRGGHGLAVAAQRGHYIVGVGGLGQVVVRAAFYRRD